MDKIIIRFSEGIELDAQLFNDSWALFVDTHTVRIVRVYQVEDGPYIPQAGSILLGKKLDGIPAINYLKAAREISLYDFMISSQFDSKNVVNFSLDQIVE
ncbi:hypothetical protein [Pseudalkalibacillus sp. NRS-1564]|uniref:hypothetical protein n=1 Tax=Pseudalkalibacillus sp. NRS-1564 TaxID=3233900 RepID=UPI003D291BA2